jgi:hypothetical protein
MFMLFNDKYRQSNTREPLCLVNDKRHESDADERHPGVT